MEPPYPRLLVDRYEPAFRFYEAILPELTGCTLARGNSSSGYASWDALDGRTALALFSRDAMVSALGESSVPSPGASLVLHMATAEALDSAVELCAGAGGTVVAAARDLPEWGPGLRAAHVLDPDGNLVELQTY
ncbi:VOC family protein [Streptomyces sp. NBC_01431]|uniref:VOC family protein n=1 Tax=Streptomyces sp. NBC_01431 TaxID=2903863 RepID=UPI002E2FED58|nr:VOC family protein [Streptomyces sp. NBC_01431]